MISKIDFSEKNLTSNSVTLMLYDHAETEGVTRDTEFWGYQIYINIQ